MGQWFPIASWISLNQSECEFPAHLTPIPHLISHHTWVFAPLQSRKLAVPESPHYFPSLPLQERVDSLNVHLKKFSKCVVYECVCVCTRTHTHVWYHVVILVIQHGEAWMLEFSFSVTKTCPSLCDPMDWGQAPLSSTISQHLLKFMSIESVMPSSHLILCHSLLLLPSIFPSIRVFSSESALCMRQPKYWSFSFSFSISPFNEYSGLISFRIGWFDLLAVQGTLKSPVLQFKSINDFELDRHLLK